MPYKKRTIGSQRLVVIGPRLQDLDQALANIGRNIDVYGLSGAVMAMLANCVLREAEGIDVSRLMALSESARLWTNAAKDWGNMQGANAREIKVIAPPSGTPMPFDLGAFERRKEDTPSSTPKPQPIDKAKA